MASQVTNYKCPSCTGPLHFDGESGNLKCDYCGNIYEVATIEALYAQKDSAAEVAEAPSWKMEMANAIWSEEEKATLRSYSCPSCGAEIICDVNTAATSCAYCGNPTIVPSQLGGALKPNLVIPFKHDKNAALDSLKDFYKNKRFLPKRFSEENHLEEIKGIYVPFWLFNGYSHGKMQFRGEIVTSHVSGDVRITTTDYYDIFREGTIDFEKIPVDASTKMSDTHMEAIEPYDYAGLVPYSNAYLPGYYADKYDVPSNDCAARAETRIRESTKDALATTVSGYTTTTPAGSEIQLQHGEVYYAMFPVWLLNTKWNNETFTFAMNGQTGKFIGNLPVDWSKFAAWMAYISVPLIGIMALVTKFL